MLFGSAELYLVSELVQLKDPLKFLIVCLHIMSHLKDWNILDLLLNKKPAGKASNLLSNAIRYGHDAKGLVIINTRDQGGRKYIFFSKQHIAHPNFPSNFHTPSESLPKISYPNIIAYVLITFYDI